MARIRLGRLSLSLVGLAVSSLIHPAASQAQNPTADAQPALLHEAAKPVEPPPSANSGDPRTPRIEDFVKSRLDVAVEPQSLFDVALDDRAAVALERIRLHALLDALDSAQKGDKPTPAPSPKLGTGPTPAELKARLALDRARLHAYDSSPDELQILLETHRRRQAEAQPAQTTDQLLVLEAERARESARAASEAAHTEAEKLVRDELSRLRQLRATLDRLDSSFSLRLADLAARRDLTFVWQRRVHEAKGGTSDDADLLYGSLRQALRASRSELDAALSNVGSPRSLVPKLGDDATDAVPPDIPLEVLKRERRTAAARIESLRRRELDLAERRAVTGLEQISTLNQERLGLLPYLSADKRRSITGFTAHGWDQARSEARHLMLILRYHRHATSEWLRTLRSSRTLGVPAWKIALNLLYWLLLIACFWWWRRRSEELLRLLPRPGLGFAEASIAERLIHLLKSIHRPLAWLVFGALAFWLLSPSSRELLEVQIAFSIATWTLVGSLVIHSVNALASGSSFADPRRHDEVGPLRLRSLRFVGRVTVAFVLLLGLGARLVGEGTIHSWIMSLGWVAGCLVFLVLVGWWRDVVFERVASLRRKTGVDHWVLAQRSGWRSFPAATVGAVRLFVFGAWRVGRDWITGFSLARRVHAYLYRRELARRKVDEIELSPLDEASRSQLAPDRVHAGWTNCPANTSLTRLLERARAGRGGVVAVVGPRGMGKSSLLRELERRVEGARLCQDPSEIAKLRVELEDSAWAEPSLVLFDDTQRLLKPVIGGMHDFDDALTWARSRANSCLWVFAIDRVLWPLLRRAHDSHPSFDEVIRLEPWDEEQLDNLLTVRSRDAGLENSFEGLLDALHPPRDQIEREDALAERRKAYFRMLWDHVRGNPGIALEVWRSSLALERTGQAKVRMLRVPVASELEALPDPALFVLRAILQLGSASSVDIGDATRLGSQDVEATLRYSLDHGYIETTDNAVRISWSWLLPISLLLERRHLVLPQ